MFSFCPPLAFLRGGDIPRHRTSEQNPVVLQDTHQRLFSISFRTPSPSDATFSTQIFPQKESQHDFESSFYRPPPHYHLLQDEHFRVDSGEGTWYLWGGKTVQLKKGDRIVVPARRWHTFDVAPDSKEPLAVSYYYDKEYVEMEETFFRNVLSYFADCRRAGVSPSIFQIMVFAMHNWMPIALPVPGPECFNLLLNTILMVSIGCVGQFLLGYKASYPEYEDEEQKRGKND
ncbi:oxidoreductase virH like protein [Verticillium longisporum]|nr:oxidoreductase virH like protein [Verticillium longisporum]